MVRQIFLVLLIIVFLTIPAAAETNDTESERSATIDAVLAEVQAGIYDAQKRLEAEGACEGHCPELKAVVVTLQSVLKKTKSRGFRFLIFSFGRKVQSSQVQTVSIKRRNA